MKAPSPPTDAQMPPPDATIPSSEAEPRPRLRRLPLAPVGGWLWIRSKRQSSQGELLRPEKRHAAVLTLRRGRRMKRCARAVWLWGLLWYAVVQLFPILLKDRWAPIGAAAERQKWPALRRLATQDPDRPLLLMLGSSRTGHALRASALDGMPDYDGRPLSVYNFGIPASGGPIHQLLFLRDMLAEGIRPRLLLVEVCPCFLGANRRGTVTEEDLTGFEWMSARRFLQWYPYLCRRGKRMHAWLQARINSWYAFRRQLHVELTCWLTGAPLPSSYYEPIDDWGWQVAPPMLPSVERQRRFENVRAGYAEGLRHFQLGKKPAKALYELFDLCRREKIPTVVVLMPESSVMRGWYSENAKARIRHLVEDLSRTYGCPVLDANCWIADDDFEDGHHTLLHGADVFTSRLAAELPRFLAQSKDGPPPDASAKRREPMRSAELP